MKHKKIRIIKVISTLFLFLLIFPYFIPRDFTDEMSEKPYDNSIFYSTKEGYQLHAQYFQADQSIGKIVMIHGLGASSFSYRNNAPFFQSQGYDVLVVDLPAFGYSTKDLSMDHSQVNRAQLLWQWMNSLDQISGDNRPWHLVGHSMGGSTVLALANQAPERVTSINLIAPAIVNENPQIGWLLKSPLGEWLKIVLKYEIITESSFRSVLESASNQPATEAIVNGYLRPLSTKGTTHALINFVATADNVLISEFQATQIEFNLLWGRDDTWVPIDQIDIIQSYVEVDHLVIFDDASHLVHETAQSFNDYLLDFIEN